MEVDKRESSGYNDQAVFSREQICGCAGTGRQASLRCWCRIDVWVQVPSAAPTSLQKTQHHARVVELADSLDSGSSVLYGRAGSSPASRTKKKHAAGVFLFGAQRSASRTAPPLAGFYWNCRKNPPWFFPQTPFSSRCLEVCVVPFTGRGISSLSAEIRCAGFSAEEDGGCVERGWGPLCTRSFRNSGLRFDGGR